MGDGEMGWSRNALAGALILVAALSGCATPRSMPVAAPIAAPTSSPTTTPEAPILSTANLRVVSFNIKFLGHYRTRDNEGLARLLSDYDLVFIQELVAPPRDVTLADGRTIAADAEARAFFDAMAAKGFDYALAPAASGKSVGESATGAEWDVAFYRPSRVQPAEDLARGFVASPVRANPIFDRVPYAFPFRARSEDLVFISVHLDAAATHAGAVDRARELSAIWAWIAARGDPERDYVILGDMNLQTCAERAAVTPAWATALGPCQMTNVLADKPFDQVLFATQSTRSEIPGGLNVINLISEMRADWDPADGAYPGDPLNRGRFERIYSDHNPIAFTIVIDDVDDD
jgi:endonuclease/exonuclease/phosphatase family metal-dependent hydrolase